MFVAYILVEYIYICSAIRGTFCYCSHIFKNVDTAEEEKRRTADFQMIFSDNILGFSTMANTYPLDNEAGEA